MICSQPYIKSNIAKVGETQPLPSFNELLTSIPLPGSFAGSSTSSSASTSPYSYYSQPATIRAVSPVQHGMVKQSFTTPVMSGQQSMIVQPHPVSVNQYYHYQYQYPPHVMQVNGSMIPSHGQLRSPPIMEGITIPTPPSSTNSHRTVRSSSATSLASPISSTASTAHSPSDCLPSLSKDSKRRHICKVCARSFTTSGHLARHNRIHTGERKHICPWPSCDARFARQDNCMQHYKTHTNGKNKRSKLSFKSKLNPKSFN
ncbi:transcriptional repressor [Scheffersomyces xylosifermentans]|uniref:transcriptional repressor n=1 Tax=Scheffersomyces xylosifermentans TaxID=1304137 RepID=UPI00315D5DCC